VAESPQKSQDGRGERFGRYVLLECIGRGGMAEVFRALAQGVEGFQRVFVVKRILKDKSANPAFIEMFINEARISALLNHPNIVQIYDFGQIDGSYFLCMEYLRGKDLLSVLRQLRTAGRPMPPTIAAHIAREVAAGLAYAHGLTQQGGKSLQVVHRDVSPSNIMLLRAGGVKLLDFGIAKAETVLPSSTNPGSNAQTGQVKGKLSYLAPEQIRNEPLDGRSDIFSLGVVLWECLTGKRLFYEKTDYQTMHNVLERPVPPPSMQRPDVPAALDFIVVRALERMREQRYASAKAMADDLDHFLAESHFAPATVPQMLDQLFGEDAMEVEKLPEPSAPQPPPRPAARVTLGALEEPSIGSRSSASLPPLSLPNAPAWPAEAPPERRLERSSPRHALLIGGAALLGIAAAVGLVVARRGTVNPSAVGSPAPPTLALRAEGEASAAAGRAVPGLPHPSGTVFVRIESDPPGAEVKGPNGNPLGVTPTTAVFTRGTAAFTITVSKPGYQPSHQAITPDRDRSAMISLRPVSRSSSRNQRWFDRLQARSALLGTPPAEAPAAAGGAAAAPAAPSPHAAAEAPHAASGEVPGPSPSEAPKPAAPPEEARPPAPPAAVGATPQAAEPTP
jgi:serine/threonine-protein kinase